MKNPDDIMKEVSKLNIEDCENSKYSDAIKLGSIHIK